MYDFTVIGAGPSGSYCAARLAKEGNKVLLIDKVQHPRFKLCGGGLTLKSIRAINKLHNGLETSGLLDYINKFYIVNPSTKEIIDFKYDKNWLALVHRDQFDNWLLNKALDAGVEFQVCNKDSLSLLENSKFLIASDGANSKIGVLVHGAIPSDRIVVATEGYIPNTSGEAFASVILNPTKDPDNGGYSWLFGRKDTIGIGTGVVRTYDRLLNFYRKSITDLSKDIYKCIIEPKDYRNWIIPIYQEGRRASMSINNIYNVAVIGDALGVADPIYAEGIAAGITSANCLIDSYNKYKDFSKYTQDLHNYEYFKEMKWMEFLQRQANSNYNTAFKLLQKPKVVDGFIKFINWEQRPSEFVKWVWKHHPLYALRLEYNVIMNNGKERPNNLILFQSIGAVNEY
jgi:flavin-dependent dehydrogenase